MRDAATDSSARLINPEPDADETGGRSPQRPAAASDSPPRLRVAIDARKLRGVESGVGSYIVNLVAAMLRQDAGLEILFIRHGRWGNGLADPRLQEVRVPFPAEIPLTPWILRRALRGRRFDIFHSPFDIAPRGFAEPVVVTIHDINWIVNPRYNSHNLFMRRVGGFFYRTNLTASMDAASRIIAISNATRNAIVEHAPWHEPKVRVIYSGIDRRRIFPVPQAEAARSLAPLLGGTDPFVLTVGQSSPYKNHFNAVRGFLEAFRDRPEYRLVLVRRPAGRDRPLEKLLATPQARAQVRTLTSVTPETLNALYNAARIVLHPSYYEGFGLPLVEAMAAGVPLVTSTVSSMPEIAGPAALLVSPADTGAIARALTSLDRDEALRARLVAAGRERLALFDWTDSARATLDVYRDVVRARAAQSL
jgi:alpha-1,3-rhamnosyl/mannosyltransferase